MGKIKEELLVFLRPSVIKSQNGIHIPCDAQAHPLRVFHLTEVKTGKVIINPSYVKKRNGAESKLLIKHFCFCEAPAKFKIIEVHESSDKAADFVPS